jgi:uncharacterized cupredoxin-like copper-binding protein
MKSNQKILTILALIALPTLALAGGGHADAHGAHAMPGMAMDDHAALGGMPGDPANVTQTIALEMNDTMRFTPDKVSVKAGETVRFYVVNKGKIAHEMVLGTADEISEHAEMMPGAGPTRRHRVEVCEGRNDDLCVFGARTS